MQPVYLLCGVPGSGKTWVSEQLSEKFDYLEHDDYINGDFVKGIVYIASIAQKPVLATCPFAERELRASLEKKNLTVIPVFIVEDGQTVRRRYEARDGKPIPTQHITRCLSIRKRAQDWEAFHGTSSEVLEHLKGLSCNSL